MLTATIFSPFGPSSCCSFSRLGISERHGPHHVAQRFSSTTWPL